jgi:predicted HicB family RNase H-like nuclease
MMEYKGYTGKIEIDDEAGILHGEVLNLRDVITFEGKTLEEIRQAFKDSIDDYLEFCATHGESPEKPFSGRLVIRISPELHRDIYVRSKIAEKSLNNWIREALEKAIQTK